MKAGSIVQHSVSGYYGILIEPGPMCIVVFDRMPENVDAENVNSSRLIEIPITITEIVADLKAMNTTESKKLLDKFYGQR